MKIRFIALIAALITSTAWSTTIVQDLRNQNRRLQSIIERNNQIINKKLGGKISDRTSLRRSAPKRKKAVIYTNPAPQKQEQQLLGDLNAFFRKTNNRAIPQDFIVGTGVSTIKGQTSPTDIYNYRGQKDINYLAPTLMLGWQAMDNLWVEGSYARRVASNVPAPGIDVTYETLAARFKYNYLTPVYNISLQPYLGYQATLVDSPGLGENKNGYWVDQTRLQRQKDYIENQKENKFILGLTVIKPMMKDFFVRGDFGSDWRSASFGMLF
ncbi:MAG: hypothetical protein KC493_08650 [Bacteriovoracaceae bacterium]|nr:hypothetical protein [Bacteriovoracaceae bacterium]